MSEEPKNWSYEPVQVETLPQSYFDPSQSRKQTQQTSSLDRLQLYLDVVGSIDPTPLTDTANAGVSLIRRDYYAAGITFAAAMLSYFADGLKFAKYSDDLLGGGAKTADVSTPPTRPIPVQKYEVGTYRDLTNRSRPGDNLTIHHVGQGHPMSQIIPNYQYLDAPAIAIPTSNHLKIPTIKGNYDGSARDLLARDINHLRQFTDAPNRALKSLIELNKTLFPGVFSR